MSYYFNFFPSYNFVESEYKGLLHFVPSNDSYETSSSYRGYSSNGYKIRLSWDKDDKELDIYLDKLSEEELLTTTTKATN